MKKIFILLVAFATFTAVFAGSTTQTITFGNIPVKYVGNPIFSAGATASSGLPVSYTSSNTSVATIDAVTGVITIAASGTTNITASQAGDGTYAAATNVAKTLAVAASGATNLFAGTSTWTKYTSGASATYLEPMITGIPTGFSSTVRKITPTPNADLQSYRIQWGINPLTTFQKNKTYAVSFKANADAARNIDFNFQGVRAPNCWIWGVTQAITTTPANYGPYLVSWINQDPFNASFFLGANASPVSIDSVQIVEVAAPEILVTDGANELVSTNNYEPNTVSGSTYRFGSANGTKTFTITNNGTVDLKLTGIPIVAITGTAFAVTSQPTITTLSPGSSTTFDVTYTSTGTKATGYFSIANNDANEGPYRVSLAGDAAKAVVTQGSIVIPSNFTTISSVTLKKNIYNSNFNFGPMAASATSDKVFTITNNGTSDLTGLAITLTGGSYAVQTALSSTTVVPGGTATFTIRYTNGATATNVNAGTISIASNDPEGPYAFTLNGGGWTPNISVYQGRINGTIGTAIADNTGSYNFGAIAVSGSSIISFDVESPSSSVPLDFTSGPTRVVVSGSSDYSLVEDIRPTIIGGDVTRFSIKFNPTSTGTKTGLVTIANDNNTTLNPYTFALTGAGDFWTGAPKLANNDAVVYAIKGGVTILSADKQAYTITNTLGQIIAKGIVSSNNQFVPVNAIGIAIVQVNKQVTKVLLLK